MGVYLYKLAVKKIKIDKNLETSQKRTIFVTMKAYIKQTTETSLFEQARIGFIKMGYEVIYYKDTPSDLTKEDIIVGYISDIQKAFLKVGVPIPQAIDYPEEINRFLCRRIKRMRTEELKDNYPYFIKPVNHKLFEGRVVREFKDLIGIQDTEIYYCEDIINFVSEWRVYITNKEIIGIKHYKGDVFKIPQEKTIKEIINSYTKQPNTYTIDIGITEIDYNVLIEVNDGYSSGNYGLTEIQYAKFLRDGWLQYMR